MNSNFCLVFLLCPKHNSNNISFPQLHECNMSRILGKQNSAQGWCIANNTGFSENFCLSHILVSFSVDVKSFVKHNDMGHTTLSSPSTFHTSYHPKTQRKSHIFFLMLCKTFFPENSLAKIFYVSLCGFPLGGP